MMKSLARRIPVRIKSYIRENWGAPFILGFMFLLIAAAFSLSVGLTVLGDEAAINAYYILVVGVVLQLVCFLKYNKNNGEKNNGSN